MTASVESHRRGGRPTTRAVADRVALVLLAVAFVAFWPAALGGSTRLIVVEGHSMEPTFHYGDLVVARTNDHPKIGDIVVYRVPKGEAAAGMMIIHRVSSIRADGTLETQGDNRKTPDPYRIRPGDIAGSPLFVVPRAGRLIGICSSPLVVGAAAGMLAVFLLWPSRRQRVVPAVHAVHPPATVDFDELARLWLEEQLADAEQGETSRSAR